MFTLHQFKESSKMKKQKSCTYKISENIIFIQVASGNLTGKFECPTASNFKCFLPYKVCKSMLFFILIYFYNRPQLNSQLPSNAETKKDKNVQAKY